MKRILITILLLMLLIPFAAALPDVYDQLRGRQMVGDAGAPWFADGASMYFGDDKDVLLTYTEGTDKFEIKDTDVAIEEDATVGGDLTVTGAVSAGGGTINGGVYDEDFTIYQAHKFTTGTGVTKQKGIFSAYLASYMNDTLIAANKDLTMAGTGKFTSGSGISKFAGAIGVTGASALNATTTTTLSATGLITGGAGVNTPTDVRANVGGALYAKTLAVNTTDGVTVNGVIFPKYKFLEVPLDNRTVTKYVFFAGENWQVVSVNEVHRVATSIIGATVRLTKVPSGRAPAASVNVTAADFTMSSTADTVVTKTVSVKTGVALVNATDRLAVVPSAALSDCQGGVMEIVLQKLA